MLQALLILCAPLAVPPADAPHDDGAGPAAVRALTLPRAESAGAVRVAPGVLSGRRNDYNLSVDAAGRRLVFARSDAEFANSRIWVAEHGAAGWSLPREASINVAGEASSDPWLTPDGRTLYFVSSRPAPGRDPARKDLDIWRVVIDDGGGFGVPERLGPEVNGDRDELGPELHDGWLYFGSSRPGGPAPFSIYRARAKGDGTFLPAEALPKVVNAGRAQGDPTFSPKGDVMVFWRLRDGSGDGDLYALRRDATGWVGEAVRLPAPFSSPGFDFTPSFTADGTGLYFASDRRPEGGDETGPDAGGLSDVYIAPTSELYRLLGGAAAAPPKR